MHKGQNCKTDNSINPRSNLDPNLRYDPIPIEIITPNQAKQFLEAAGFNRNVKPINQQTILAEMNSGRWNPYAALVHINSQGELINGQHRLFALIEYGQPLPFAIVRDFNDQAMLDIQAPRTRLDQYQIYLGKTKDTTYLDLSVNLIWRFEQDIHMNAGNIVPSIREGQDLLERHPGILDILQLQYVRKIAGRGFGAVIPVCFYIFGLSHSWERDLFFKILLDGLGEGVDTKHPVYVLRELMKDRPKFDSPEQVHKLALIIKAWNLFLKNKSISQLKWPANKNDTKFPNLLDNPFRTNPAQISKAGHKKA